MEESYYERTKFKIKIKYLVSKLGNLLISSILRMPFHDITNSYRAIRRETIDEIDAKSPGPSFFMEFAVKAYKKRFRITEYPVTFTDRIHGKSKLNLVKETFNTFKELLKLVLIN